MEIKAKVCKQCNSNFKEVNLEVCKDCGWDFWLPQFLTEIETNELIKYTNKNQEEIADLENKIRKQNEVLLALKSSIIESNTVKNNLLESISLLKQEQEKTNEEFNRRKYELEKLKIEEQNLEVELSRYYEIMTYHDSLIKNCNNPKLRQIVVRYTEKNVLFRLFDGNKLPDILLVVEKVTAGIGLINKPQKSILINDKLDSKSSKVWSLEIEKQWLNPNHPVYLNFTTDINEQSPYFLEVDGAMKKYKS